MGVVEARRPSEPSSSGSADSRPAGPHGLRAVYCGPSDWAGLIFNHWEEHLEKSLKDAGEPADTGPRSSKRFSGKRKRPLFLGVGIQGRGEVTSRAPWCLVASVSHQIAARMETMMQAMTGLWVPAGLRDAPWGQAATAQPWS